MSTLLEEIEQDNWLGEPGDHRIVPLGRPATIADLSHTRLKAEIAHDQLVVIGPSGCAPADAAGAILFSLLLHKRAGARGKAFGSRLAYLVDLPHRRSLCPDVSWYTGPLSDSDDFPRAAPVFAVEVRDAIDYGEDADAHYAAKRADYFAAGTAVVWDGDVLREGLIRVHRADDPDHPTAYHRGEVADAEPAVPGWRMPVDRLFG